MKFWQSRHNPDTKLSQQELLDISEEITQTYAPQASTTDSELVLMPVDPNTLYAYWNLNANAAQQIYNKEFTLRIYSIPELSEHLSSPKLYLDIIVSSLHGQQKIHLPIAATAYSGMIGTFSNLENSFNTLVSSEIIHIPRAAPAPTKVIPKKSVISDKKISTTNNTATKHQSSKEYIQPQPVPNTADDSLFLPEIKTPLKLPMEQAQSNFWSHTNNIQSAEADTAYQLDTFIYKNFNDYGYDLIVYTQENEEKLDQQNYKTHSLKIPNTQLINTSGLGLN